MAREALGDQIPAGSYLGPTFAAIWRQVTVAISLNLDNWCDDLRICCAIKVPRLQPLGFIVCSGGAVKTSLPLARDIRQYRFGTGSRVLITVGWLGCRVMAQR